MRIDHHAYQRATRIAGVGFMVQGALGLTLLIFSRAADPTDTTLLFASAYVLIGLLAWLGLVLLFKQHQLERLEALEYDEVVAAGSAFDVGEDEEIRVASRRVRKMHALWLPGLSLLIAATLGFVAWRLVARMQAVNAADVDQALEFQLTDHVGWAIALCLAFTAISFIMSRFVAGMAKLEAWHNLRSGAGFMVGNSVVCLAVAVGIAFRFFDKDGVIEGIAWSIPIFMTVQSLEIVLNFVLNLYRPRIAGEVPRVAYDSKVLSLLAAPDNIVRSINEAVNYQFGFDITSSWGYQLLMRSFAWLLAGGIVVVVVLNMGVVVEPKEQAVKLAGGAIVGDPHESGLMVKLPWPFQTAEVHPVTTVRTLHLTSKRVKDRNPNNPVHLWTDDLGQSFDVELDPFVVGASAPAEDGGNDAATGVQSLLDCEIAIQYRIRSDGGLLDYLMFTADEKRRRASMTQRELSLRNIALREIVQYLSTLTIDDVLARRRANLGSDSQALIQDSFDRHATGIEVVSVDYLMIRPHGDSARVFEELTRSVQQRRQVVTGKTMELDGEFIRRVGSVEAGDLIHAEIKRYRRLDAELGSDHEDVRMLRAEIRDLIVDAGGQYSQMIIWAERDRWVQVLGASAQAMRIRSETGPYLAFPELYRQHEIMRVYEQILPGLAVTVLGMDPSRVNIQYEQVELDPLLQISDAINPEGGAP